jgi:hypothetical protein
VCGGLAEDNGQRQYLMDMFRLDLSSMLWSRLLVPDDKDGGIGTSAYVSIRQHAPACVSMRQHASAYASIRQHTSAHDAICSWGACLFLTTRTAKQGTRLTDAQDTTSWP